MPGTRGHGGAAISLPTVWDQPEGPERTFTALPSGDPTAAGTGMYVEGAVHQLPWITATIANKSPKFHLPPGLTPAPREVPHGSSHCMNTEMQLLGLPPCLTSSTNTRLRDELCPCSASQTYARLPGDIASSSWAGSF